MKTLIYSMLFVQLVAYLNAWAATTQMALSFEPMPHAVQLTAAWFALEGFLAAVTLFRIWREWPVKIPVETEGWIVALYGMPVAEILFLVVIYVHA